MDPKFKRVWGEANRWGVKVTWTSEEPRYEESRGSRTGPYGSFIHWPSGRIQIPRFWVKERPRFYACAFVHEISHVIVGQDPTDIYEELESSLLAMDYEMCRRLRLPWIEWQTESLGNGEWTGAPLKERRKMLRESRQQAELLGLMRKGKPTFQRVHIQ